MPNEKRFLEILYEMDQISKKLKNLINEACECCDHPEFNKNDIHDDWRDIHDITYTCLKCGKRFEFNQSQPEFDKKSKNTRWFGWPFEQLSETDYDDEDE